MHQAPHIYFTVTNDLVFDQRMQRICSAVANAGYKVTLVGRVLPQSPPLPKMPFEQVRLRCKNHKGKLFYAEYNWRLYRYLLGKPMDAICAIDLDTIVPVLMVSKKRNIPRMYDAHEYFIEMTEIKRRPLIYHIWNSVEKYCVPKFAVGYTVCQSITQVFLTKYNVKYETVRNIPLFTPPLIAANPSDEIQQILTKIGGTNASALPIVLYQGAVNEGRGLIQLISSMQDVNARLVIAGAGNMMHEVTTHVEKSTIKDRVFLLGNLPPVVLKQLTPYASIGINLVENTGLNQYYSLANKFFDFIMAHKPQITMNYPEYKAINDVYSIALLINELTENEISSTINHLLNDKNLYNQLQANCTKAAKDLCWEKEEIHLLAAWNKLLPIKNKGE
jgi:hypothetical protein